MVHVIVSVNGLVCCRLFILNGLLRMGYYELFGGTCYFGLFIAFSCGIKTKTTYKIG
ncbi:hypothetical protein ACOMICROBIO_GDFFDHBD_03168 [Vibrio sp. B1REV9]|nr:hypothetical protein ACOMICROBIO_GDFFDHBD_03168 [Vibrio sp. B1REV9]